MQHFLLVTFLGLSFHLSAQQAPNIVLILVDDMGWNGTSIQLSPTEPGSASDYYLTPALEALAAQGMTFSQAYAPAPKCSPTRCSIMTGRTTARNKFTNTSAATTPNKKLITPSSATNINTADITLAEWLHDTNLGYQTAHFGKWHLRSNGTSNNGFDVGDGNTDNVDGDAADGLVPQADPKKMFDLTNRSINFMQTAVSQDQPFYLQLSHYAVHELVEARPETIAGMATPPAGNIHTNVNFGAMTQDLDAAIGLLLEEIETLQTQTTRPFYIIFTSDNGASNMMSSNVPLRRGKTFIYEGGIRVPFIIKGPNIPANTHSAEPVVGYDLFPTIADWVQSATGNTTALPADMDGQSIESVLTQSNFIRTQPLYFHSPHYEANAAKTPGSAVVSGHDKVIVEYETGQNYLYNLSTDISEVTDISADNPILTRDLCIKLRNHLKEVGAAMPALDPTHVDFSGLGGTATDVDNDGLEDVWEFRELLSYTFGPNDDPDGDNLTNLQEFNNGTDPYVDETVLAIDERTSFTATVLPEHQVQLAWQTSPNSNVDIYEIERSTDALYWSSIGKIAATSARFIDKNVPQGVLYYRLKIVRINGVIDHSPRVWVEIKNNDWLLLYPNPSEGNMTLQFAYPFIGQPMVSVQVAQVDGRKVLDFERPKAEHLSFDLSGLAKGVYVVTVLENGRKVGESRVVIGR